ncbi:hypothetical protein [Streptomyces sp. Root1310]|uniref:hypothetical protein n=1 Tax=Streptomyces sp. Root1310 TaxID=1736452 RepID=UPI0007251FC9|nr:hypothetical protein [Streptomyces sp. Root1310]KQX65493.1 hypothetical protein ASD48_20895 [Streptomyces sp. Root1310]
MPDDGNMIGEGNPVGEATAAMGLWMALAGAVSLVVIGVVALVAGMSAGLWISVAGLLCTLAVGASLYFRRR